jgi:hypothetical protein
MVTAPRTPQNIETDHALQDNPQLSGHPEAAPIVKASDRRTRGANRLFLPHIKVTVYKQSFFPRTIYDWTRLPTKTTDISDISAFKASLHASVAAPPLSSA